MEPSRGDVAGSAAWGAGLQGLGRLSATLVLLQLSLRGGWASLDKLLDLKSLGLTFCKNGNNYRHRGACVSMKCLRGGSYNISKAGLDDTCLICS